MPENIYKTPESELDEQTISLAGENTFSSSKLKKTIIMNCIGGVGILLLGTSIYFNKSIPNGFLTPILVFYSLMAFTAFGSAHAIKSVSSTKFRLLMLILNWLFVVLYVISILGVILTSKSSAMPKGIMLISQLMGALLFAVPQIINIRAFRFLKKQIITE